MQPSELHLLQRIKELEELKKPSKEQKALLIELKAKAKALAQSQEPVQVDRIPADDEQKES